MFVRGSSAGATFEATSSDKLYVGELWTLTDVCVQDIDYMLYDSDTIQRSQLDEDMDTNTQFYFYISIVWSIVRESNIDVRLTRAFVAQALRPPFHLDRTARYPALASSCEFDHRDEAIKHEATSK